MIIDIVFGILIAVSILGILSSTTFWNLFSALLGPLVLMIMIFIGGALILTNIFAILTFTGIAGFVIFLGYGISKLI